MNLSNKRQTETPKTLSALPTATQAPETKPRKVNSEVRKQQNRIASRNYREKRKRKLQKLQQLLEEDDPGERQVQMRSESPYEDRSCSGSVGYERSVASASPHIAAVPSNFSSPQPSHSAIANQAWNRPVSSSTEHSLMYTHPYSESTQQMTAYSLGGPTTTSYPTWNTFPPTGGTVYSITDPSQYSTCPPLTFVWPSSGFEDTYQQAVHRQEVVSSSYTPLWQYHTSEEPPPGIVLDSYGRRYYPYEPQ